MTVTSEPGGAALRSAGIRRATTLAGRVPYLRYELRRHAATLALGLLLLGLLPLARRLIVEDYRYWDGEWNVWGAVLALYVVMPLLVLAMTASGWARERSLHTLEWLYARPISSSTLFIGRAALIAVAALAWSGLAFAVHRVGLGELELALSTTAGLPGPALLFVAQLLLALGAGLLASTVAPSAEAAFRSSLLVVIGTWVAAVLPGRTVAHAEVLVAGSRGGFTTFLDQTTGAFLITCALALLAAAWRVMACAPEDPGRLRRVGVAGAPVAGFLLFAQLSILHVPLLAGSESSSALWLGGESGLTFAAARGLGAFTETRELRLYHPVVREKGRDDVLRNVYVPLGAGIHAPRGSAARGAAMIPIALSIRPELGQRWMLVERDGSRRELALGRGSSTSIGWSPSGERFAWTWTPWARAGVAAAPSPASRIVLLEHDSTIRTLEPDLSDSLWMRAAWIDDRTLLRAPVPGPERRVEQGWAIVHLDGAGEIVRHALPRGQVLAAPVLHYWGVSATRLPRIGEHAAVLVAVSRSQGLWPGRDDEYEAEAGPEETPPRLARLIVEGSGRLEPGPTLPPMSLSISMGNLDDGSLVWAVPDRRPLFPNWDGGERTRLMRLRSFDGEPELLCSAPTGRIFSFLGQSGPWAVWDTGSLGRRGEYRVWGCNVETGQTREIVEWRTWAHPGVAITDRGLWSPRGWIAMAE